MMSDIRGTLFLKYLYFLKNKEKKHKTCDVSFVLFLFLFFFFFFYFPLFCFVCLFFFLAYSVWEFHHTLNMTQYTLQSPFIILVCPAKVLIFRCPFSASFDLKLFHSLKSATVQVYSLICCFAFFVFTNSLCNVCLFYVLP